MIRASSKFVLAALLSFAIPALGGGPASVGGVVQDADHAPLMGAIVELLGSTGLPVLTAFTDIHGRYQFSNLSPGRYNIRVLQSYSIPAHRRNIRVGSTTHATVNLTLISLFSMTQWFPATPRGVGEPADDWKWTLRSGVDRPILRWLDGMSVDTRPNRKNRRGETARSMHVHAELTSGSSQFGDGGFQQEALVRMRRSMTGDAVFHLRTSTTGAAFLGAGMERDQIAGDAARAVATYRTLPVDAGAGQGRLQIFQVRGGEQLTLSDAVLAQFGAETEAVRSGQVVTAALPFMAVHLRNDGNQISYRLATSRQMQGLEDIAAAGDVPALAMQSGHLRVTHCLHQEVSLQRKLAGMQLEAAYFYDRLVDPVLNGYGDVNASEFAAGDVLLDPATGAFRSAGPNYSGGGFRVFARRQVKGGVWTAIEFAEGPAIVLPAGTLAGTNTFTQALTNVQTTRTQSVLFSMQGRVRGSHTGWTAGYRWQPESTISAVDPFNTGLSAPFLSVTLRQPLGSGNSAADRLELEIVMQNMLAQGYRPIYVVDGQTLYFAQASRLVTGGLAFSF